MSSVGLKWSHHCLRKAKKAPLHPIDGSGAPTNLSSCLAINQGCEVDENTNRLRASETAKREVYSIHLRLGDSFNPRRCRYRPIKALRLGSTTVKAGMAALLIERIAPVSSALLGREWRGGNFPLSDAPAAPPNSLRIEPPVRNYVSPEQDRILLTSPPSNNNYAAELTCQKAGRVRYCKSLVLDGTIRDDRSSNNRVQTNIYHSSRFRNGVSDSLKLWARGMESPPPNRASAPFILNVVLYAGLNVASLSTTVEHQEHRRVRAASAHPHWGRGLLSLCVHCY